jgi:hypothetical protein
LIIDSHVSFLELNGMARPCLRCAIGRARYRDEAIFIPLPRPRGKKLMQIKGLAADGAMAATPMAARL